MPHMFFESCWIICTDFRPIRQNQAEICCVLNAIDEKLSNNERTELLPLEEEKARLAAERAERVDAGEVDEEELTEEEQRQLTEKQTLQQLIDQKPAEVAMLIKTWLAEDE